MPSLAQEITDALDGPIGGRAPSLPAFNHAEWGDTDDGSKFITAHFDPDTAGGIVAVLTVRGAAPFRIWPLGVPLAEARTRSELATEWVTAAGGLVLMQSGGWPRWGDRCPIHAVDSPPSGSRFTLTLRHNKGGYGTDYFR